MFLTLLSNERNQQCKQRKLLSYYMYSSRGRPHICVKKRVTIPSFLLQSRGATKSTCGQSIVAVESIRPGWAREFSLLTEHMHPQLFRTLWIGTYKLHSNNSKRRMSLVYRSQNVVMISSLCWTALLPKCSEKIDNWHH